MTALVLTLALSGCVVPTDEIQGQEKISFTALSPSSGGALLPSQIMSWESNLPNRTLQEVILEAPDGRKTICTTAEASCFAPVELLAATDYQWWVRAITTKGIVRSDSFTAATPPLAADLEVSAPDRLPASGRFDWTASGASATYSAALFRPDDGGPVTACAGDGCSVNEPLRGSTTYEVELRAYGSSGLYVAQTLSGVQINQPPASVRAVSPQPGAEVGVGETRLEWTPAEDLEQDGVTYRLLWTRAGEGTWSEGSTETVTSILVSVAAGQTYAWRVEARDTAGNVVLSPIFLFNTPDAPPTAILLDDATRIPPRGDKVFAWVGSASSQSVEYRKLDSTEPWTFACSGTSTCTTRLSAEPGSSYEWRVRHDDAYAGTSTSAVGTFDTAPLAVLIHGLWSNGETWSSGVEALSTMGFAVLSVDVANPLPVSLSYEPLSDADGIRSTALNVVAPQVNQALADAGYPKTQPVILIGHSMGGLISRVVADAGALDHEVERIITLGTPHQGSIWANEIVQFAGKKVATLVVQGLLSSLGFGIPSIIIGASINAMMSPWKAALNDLAPRSDFIVALDAGPSDVPVWTIAGTDDLIVSVPSAIAPGEKVRLVPLGHTQLTGKFCDLLQQTCSVDKDAIDIVDEWMRLDG